MAAFIVVDPDESSYLEQPSYLDKGAAGGNNVFRMPMPVHQPTLAKRNLCDDFESSDNSATLLPVPNSKETIQVYLRVKPRTLEESEISAASSSAASASAAADRSQEDADSTAVIGETADEGQLLQIESEHQVAMNAPKESVTYKNSMNGAGQLLHRFAFSKIFPAETGQAEFFREMVMPRMRDLMEGQNQLLFTYGATSSGKTYTIQGPSSDPGILPRSLDVIFNSIGDRQMTELKLKPNCFNRVVQMKDKDVKKLEEDKQTVFSLGIELAAAHHADKKNHADFKMSGISKLSEDTFSAADVTNLSQNELTAMFPDLCGRLREDSEIQLKHEDIHYAVWISFAEIYNENIYDLLEKIPPVKRKGDRPKRNPLKLAEDKNGSIYVKGLKEIKVNSADEAYQVMMIGRKNLHFAATRLNHQSSRSHCIFTIKVIRVAETAKPHLARVSMLSFCDLAGAERIKKTLNTGERQKEAGNINTSLLVLGRCMKAIRCNQLIKEKRKHQLVPFRESKLTRMFQSFLVGYGKASMVVNVSQAPYLFDETVQVMKFAAVTSKITVVHVPETPPTVVPNRKRKTRFSMMVDDHQAKLGSTALMGRGSIAWERPAARSTLCPARNETAMEDTILEESVMETTVVDERYKGLNQLIDNLKDQLIKEKQKNITLEREVRTELCDEFNQMLVEVEKDWEKRLQDERERTEEVNEWRINKVQEFYRAKRKRQRLDHEDCNVDMDETAAFRRDELEIALEEKTTELECLQEKLTAMEEQSSNLAKEKAKCQEDLIRLERAVDKETKEKEDALDEVKKIKKELEVKEMSETSHSSEPIIEELKRQLEESKAKIHKLEEEKNGLRELLDEAGEDFVEKKEELDKALQTMVEQEQQALRNKVLAGELSGQLEESRMLLQDSAARMEEKEQQIAELEEQVEAAGVKEKELLARLSESEAKEEQLELRLEQENDEALKELDRLKEKLDLFEQKANDEKERMERELNDEIEELKSSKKKLKAQLEEQNKKLEDSEKMVTKMEGEVKSLIQAEKQQRQSVEDKTAEVDMLRKQVKDVGAKEAESKKKLESTLKDRESELEKLRIQLGSLEKEGRAIDVIQDELKSRTKERDDLWAQVTKLNSEVEAKAYDLTKMKEERDTMMTTYEQRLKKTTEELSMEKREAVKMREVMLKSTPESSGSKLARSRGERLDRENTMLREELQKKTDVIKKLESMIPAKKELRYPTSGDESEGNNTEDSGDEINLKGEVVRLQRELETERTARAEESAAHAKEIKKIKQANDKETNRELQKSLSVTSTSAATDHSTLEADNSNNADGSLIEETPGRARKRARKAVAARGRARKNKHNKTDSASQASFEDSNVENDPEEDSGPSRRSSRLKRSRPVRKTRSNSLASQDSSLTASSSRNSEMNVLQAIQESSPNPTAVSTAKTPSARKRQLYDAAAAAQQFTPPTAESLEGPVATPRTVVKRQLRSRSSRKKC